MPTNSKGFRKKKRDNWKTNYQYFLGSPEEIKRRAARNKARNDAVKAGRVKKWDKSKEIDHVDGNPKNNSKKNTRVVSRKANRVKGANKANKKTNLYYV